ILVEKLEVDEAEVIEEANFVNDLGADDLDLVELVMQFEKEFNISIPDYVWEKLNTVGDVINYLDKQLIMEQARKVTI
ncbi:MAG: acyl carrier protein, partial [Bacteroidales bacterium]|nr:acyl carrier protein [Bacteroidales bacterium]